MIILCCIAFAAQGVEAQQQAKSHVTLSLDEFEELFSSARLEEAQRRLLDQRKKHEAEHNRKMAELQNEAGDADIKARQERSRFFPKNYQVLQHTASGSYNASAASSGVERDVASFELDLTIRIMESRWTMVPLANTTSMVTSDWKVTWKDQAASDFSVINPVYDQDAMLVMRDGQQVLATKKSGIFNVRFMVHTRVGKVRNLHAVGVSSLLYPLSGCTLRVATGAKSGVRKDFSVSPKEAVLQVRPPEGEAYTEVHATLPLTSDMFQIKWIDSVVEEKREESKQDDTAKNRTKIPGIHDKDKSLTSFHSVLHRVEEGMIRSFNVLEFTANSGESISSVEFVVHGHGVRIASVEGHALQGWAVGDSDESSSVIQASFKTSQVGSKVTVQVCTELERQDSVEEEVLLPSVECKNVLRQTGQVAIVKDANVEVHEHNRSGISPCDASELSSQLRLNTDRPIVLGYKYLNPRNSIVLNVTEHVAMETLEATIDRVHYRNVVTDKLSVHSLILIMQSTKLQYLELHGLPPSASMFTVMVNSVPAKPVSGGQDKHDSSILIPLLVGQNTEAANEGGSMRTSIELNYVSTHEAALRHNGTLGLAPPHFSLPVSVYTAHLRLPESYLYNFTGDFGNESSTRLEYPIPTAFSYVTGKRVVRDDYEFSLVDDVWPEDRKETASDKKSEPIKIVTPKTGKSHYFHRLLVLDGASKLHVTYSEPPKEEASGSWWSKMLFGEKVADV